MINLLRFCHPYIQFGYARVIYFQFISFHTFMYGIFICHKLSLSAACKQIRVLRIVADFHRLPCYLINIDILPRSLKLLKHLDSARYFKHVSVFRIFHGISRTLFVLAFMRQSIGSASEIDLIYILQKTSGFINFNNIQKPSIRIKVTHIFYHFQISLYHYIMSCPGHISFFYVCNLFSCLRMKSGNRKTKK